ncbi:laccase domain-containing protein [Helicobacter aurati]|uniref:Laccase domain-containing protein n=1 Tax=Helicobacter aurati TaxID=137778 RepID=A0A3D8J8F9_9HELI|nr:polyphenol oxidase family protein [Helicobacter aurati]RDU73783.1 laccase domain-containing protein [Helicobacter aurati]
MNTFYSSTQSPLFNKDSVHFILTNKVSNSYNTSKSPYNSLNLAYHVGDTRENVQSNRQAIMQTYYPNKTLLYLNQIHSADIIDIQHTNLTTSLDEILLGNGDGIICDSQDYVCLIMTADCNPILMYCPTQRVFALLHAGRLGTTMGIVTNGVTKLQQQYNVIASNIKIFIGASIRACCYEIGLDIAEYIRLNFGNKYLHYDMSSKNSIRLDMIAMLYDEMLACGILTEHIEILSSCSCCDKRYFSYRRDGVTGRFGLFACIKQ